MPYLLQLLPVTLSTVFVSTSTHRHPQSSSRPAATDVVLALMENEEVVLRVPKDDAATDRLAGVIGAPLKAGEHMYPELQEMYYSSL